MTRTLSRLLSPIAMLAIAALPAGCGGDSEKAEGEQGSGATHAAAARVVSLAPDYDAEKSTAYVHRQRMQYDDVITAEDMFVQEESVAVDATRAFTLTTEEMAPDGSALVTLRFDRIAMTLERTNLPAFRYDSAEPLPLENQRPLDKMLDEVFRSEISFTMRPNGEVAAVRGVPTAASLGVSTGLERNLLLYFNESWFRSIADEIWDVAGEKNRRSLDEEWSKESLTQVEDGEKTVIAYRLTGLQEDGRLAVIEGAGILVPEGEKPAGIENATVLDQSLYFRMDWSVPLGRTVGYESRQLLKIQTGGRGGRLTRELIVELKLERVPPENEASGKG